MAESPIVPTKIANFALAHLNISERIANIELDKSLEAQLCREFYSLAINNSLRDHDWPFATVLGEALALVSTNPNVEWGYAYRYPTQCHKFRRILSGVRNETEDTKVPHKFGRDTEGQLIFTDKVNAQCEYTFKEEDPNRFPPDFIMMSSYLLAVLIAPTLTGGDPFKIGQKCLNMYLLKASTAEKNASNEETKDRMPDSEFIRSRE